MSTLMPRPEPGPLDLKVAAIARSLGCYVSPTTGWWMLQFETLLQSGINHAMIPSVMSSVTTAQAQNLVGGFSLWEKGWIDLGDKTQNLSLHEVTMLLLEEFSYKIMRRYENDLVRAKLVLEQKEEDDGTH